MEKQDTNNQNSKKSILMTMIAIIALGFIQYLWPALLLYAIYESIKKLVSKSQFIENVPSKSVAKINENKILS